ncbi:MAG: D-alanyl-D-alanine carboxypeptidase/D-alanyl-D-alanine-endopeptidase [Gammaproteobacteria bacterium]|nr:D-alanyl-D-alanine carboxypeptidase/D-alanyl-D-alanine-endopeptidase [Gammaproteobacteria bacterium]
MRQLLLLLTLLLSSGAVTAQDALPARIQRIVNGYKLPASSYSIVVQDVTADTPLLAVNADVPRNPASVIKLLTTITGLEVLGPAYTWRTEIFVDGKLNGDVLEGNLVIRGRGDPYLTTDQFWRMVKALRLRGIRVITGDLLLDDTYFDVPPHDANAFDGQGDRAYNVGPDALLVNFQATNFYVMPAADGKSIAVKSDPEMPNLHIKNRLTAGNGSCSGYQRGVSMHNVTTDEGADVTFSGSYPTRCGDYAMLRSVLTADNYAYGMFAQLWRESGGEFTGTVGRTIVTDDKRPYMVWTSPPLGDQVRSINKFSNNVMTRHLMLTLGAETFGPPATLEKGRQAIDDFLAARNIDTSSLTLINGSGLSRDTRISAAMLRDVLLLGWRSPFMSEYVSSLSISGMDGTMRRRLRDGDTAGRMHLKTGTLDEVSAIAGYVHAATGRHFLVVVMVNHPSANRGPGQELGNALMQWVYRQ